MSDDHEEFDFEEFKTKITNIPGLTPGTMFKKYEFSKLITHFTKLVPAKLPQPMGKNNIIDGVALEWQGFSELDEDHGFSATYGVLCNTPFVSLKAEKPTSEIVAEIEAKVGPENWSRVERHLESLGNKADKNGHRRVFLVAFWAEIFAEPFGELWLAAMAQHAYYVLENDFAFGYLTALLDQKQQNEAHFLRGKKGLDSAKRGGSARAQQSKANTQAVLHAMELHHAAGKSTARAAELALRSGHGSSAEANRKLWSRHRKK